MKNNIKIHLFLLLSLCFATLHVTAQKKALYDSSNVEQRSFSAQSIQQYKNDPDFRYDAKGKYKLSIWQKIWIWLSEQYDRIMSTSAGRTTMFVFFTALAAAAIGFFVYMVIKANRVSLFNTASKDEMKYSVEDENINQISFPDAIAKALAHGNYRLALRLLYLQNLKMLSDKNLIVWQLNKTNYDYVRELINENLRTFFARLTAEFEHAWYGNRLLSKDDFTDLEKQFSQFKQQL